MRLPPPVLEPLYKEEHVPGEAEVKHEAILVQTDRGEPQENPPVDISKEVLTLEQEMHKNTRVAIDSYKLASKHAENYRKALHQIVCAEPGSTGLFTQLKSSRADLDKAVEAATDANSVARGAMDTLDRMIRENEIKAPPEELAMTKRYIKTFREDLNEAEKHLKEVMEKTDISEKYWGKIEAARKFYEFELRAMFPGIDLCAKRLDSKGDVDLLLLYTMNQVQFLQNQIAELETIMDFKLKKAIECKDEKALIEAKVQQEIQKERAAMERDYQRKMLNILAEDHRKAEQEIKKQMEIQEKINTVRLKAKEKEINRATRRAISEQTELERVKFKKELAAMAAKLQAIEATLRKRAVAEGEAKKSQNLWAAAEALLAATRKPADITKVDNELKALEKAGQNDKLVQSVLKGIPQEARDQGIFTEKALREKFDTLEQRAAKVALVGRQGAALPVYFLSWLQSKLLFSTLADVPQKELDNVPIDFTQLDTFDIIRRARYHMDHGDLGTALRYVNLLQGAPRAAAQCWLAAARTHLEIKQAAEAVMAHASLAGMLPK